MPDIKCPATATAVLACTFVLSGTGALAQGDNAYRGIDTVAGKSHRLGVCGNVQKDCTSGPPPAIRVVVPPKHGELNVRSGNLKAGRITRCPNLRATAQGVFYQSKPKYSGTDEVSYEVTSASGKVETHIVRITVKEGQPGDQKPGQDADPDL
jgi:hypothetical protein